jgi:hypothetical protein
VRTTVLPYFENIQKNPTAVLSIYSKAMKKLSLGSVSSNVESLVGMQSFKDLVLRHHYKSKLSTSSLKIETERQNGLAKQAEIECLKKEIAALKKE